MQLMNKKKKPVALSLLEKKHTFPQNAQHKTDRYTSMTQTSGSIPSSSTETFACRMTRSCIASVMCGTTVKNYSYSSKWHHIFHYVTSSEASMAGNRCINLCNTICKLRLGQTTSRYNKHHGTSVMIQFIAMQLLQYSIVRKTIATYWQIYYFKNVES